MISQTENKAHENPSTDDKNALNEPKIQSFHPPHAVAKRYDYVRHLGKGSQGQVWLARQRETNTLMAVKQLSIPSLKNWKQYELFKREAKMLATLNIEGVVPFCEYIESLDENPASVCIVQKYIAGETLASLLKAKHRFKTEAIYDIVAQVLKILEKLHHHRPPVIHRDIKPSNLMLTPVGNGFYRVTLIDFGAVANPQVQTGGSTVTGTYGYMPPEQLMGQSQPASDIYALAAVAVELLSGMSPSEIEVCDFKLVIEPYLMHLPKEVVHTLNLMLAPAIENRICDHQVLIEQFEAFSHQRQTSKLNILHRTTLPKLENVESIGQMGNYEIWQNLNQNTKIDFEKCPCHLDFIKSFRGFDKLVSLLHIEIFAVITILSFIVYLNATFQSNIILNILFLVILSFSISGLFFVSKSIVHKRLFLLKTLEKAPFSKLSTHDYYRIQDVLTHGQKIVGKIVAIDYIGVNEEYSVTQVNRELKPHILTSDFPKFSIIYHFQYTSDLTAGVISFYGECFAYTCPENRYNIGDPITLIADISPPSESSFRLSVTPYPYPFGDILNIEDALYTCEIDKIYLSTGEIRYGKQLALYCLVNFDHCNDKTILQAADEYTKNEHDHLISQRLYKRLAQRYLSRFEPKDHKIHENSNHQNDEYLHHDNENLNTNDENDKIYYNESDAYRNMNPNQSNKFYEQLGEQFLLRSDVGTNEAMRKIVEFHIDTLYNKQKFTNFYERLAQQYLLKFEEQKTPEMLTLATDIYRNKLENTTTSKILYTQLAQLYITMYKTNADLDALSNAAKIYQWELNDKTTATNCYRRLLQEYTAIYEVSRDEKLLLKAAEISRWELNSEVLAKNYYQQLANHLMNQFNTTHDENTLLKVIQIYREQLQNHTNAKIAYAAQTQLYLDKFETNHDGEYLIKAAEIFLWELNDKENYIKCYRKFVNTCISQFNHIKDDKILLKAADICQWELNDKNASRACYECLGQFYIAKFEHGDDEAIVKAAKIYHDQLYRQDDVQMCLEKLKNRCLQRIQNEANEALLLADKDYCNQIAQMLAKHETQADA